MVKTGKRAGPGGQTNLPGVTSDKTEIKNY